MRIQALSALGDRGAADDDTVRSTLEAALADRDASVRGQALQALAVLGGSEAMEHLRQSLRDSDPGVRIMAVERVEPRDEGIALLQEALADADETVRSLAASRLKQVRNQVTSNPATAFGARRTAPAPAHRTGPGRVGSG